jgi:hypothetical protein
MKKIAILLVALSATFALAQKPKIVFTKSDHDFGDIEKGDKVKTVFEFQNTGDAPLEIINVGTSCGCTTAKPEKTTYQPNEKGQIPVEFDSTRFSGPITKRITITTNDAESPKTVVTIKGMVTVDIEFKPSSVFFPNAKMGSPVSQDITLSTTKLDSLEISNIKVNIENDCVSAAVKKVDAKNLTMTVTADGNKFPAGKARFSGYLTFDTNSESQGTIRVPVTVNVRRPVKATPNSVYFFASKQGKERDVNVSIVSNENKSFKVTKIESDLDFIKVEIKEDNGGKKSLVATLSADAKPGKFSGKIKLTLNVPDQPELEIPIRGSVVQ